MFELIDHLLMRLTEVSIPHGEFFLALGFAYPLLYSLQSRQRYPTQLQDS